jgi:hypothetical protein
MKVYKALRASLGLVIVAAQVAKGQFNNPPNVDIWCGKAYKAG